MVLFFNLIKTETLLKGLEYISCFQDVCFLKTLTYSTYKNSLMLIRVLFVNRSISKLQGKNESINTPLTLICYQFNDFFSFSMDNKTTKIELKCTYFLKNEDVFYYSFIQCAGIYQASPYTRCLAQHCKCNTGTVPVSTDLRV